MNPIYMIYSALENTNLTEKKKFKKGNVNTNIRAGIVNSRCTLYKKAVTVYIYIHVSRVYKQNPMALISKSKRHSSVIVILSACYTTHKHSDRYNCIIGIHLRVCPFGHNIWIASTVFWYLMCTLCTCNVMLLVSRVLNTRGTELDMFAGFDLSSTKKAIRILLR